jgi:hypothetical protein
MGRGLGSSERSGREEQMWVAIHMYMEAVLGISLYNYFYLKLSHYLYVFSSTKSENKRMEQVFPGNMGGGANKVYTCK